MCCAHGWNDEAVRNRLFTKLTYGTRGACQLTDRGRGYSSMYNEEGGYHADWEKQ